jgi:hypothetical protein
VLIAPPGVTSEPGALVTAQAVGQHPIHGAGVAFLYCLVLGPILIISAAGSLATRRWRGHEGAPGQIRGMERTAGTALRVGTLLTAVGAVGFGLWWLILR